MCWTTLILCLMRYKGQAHGQGWQHTSWSPNGDKNGFTATICYQGNFLFYFQTGSQNVFPANLTPFKRFAEAVVCELIKCILHANIAPLTELSPSWDWMKNFVWHWLLKATFLYGCAQKIIDLKLCVRKDPTMVARSRVTSAAPETRLTLQRSNLPAPLG